MARLVAERDALVRGDTTWIGVALDVASGWHVFWNGWSDTGPPPRVRPILPEGFRAGEILWPVPTRHVSPGRILDHVYEGEVLLLLPIVATRDAPLGDSATITCDLDWVACRDACVLGETTVSLTLPIEPAGRGARLSAGAPMFRRARARLPRPLPPDREAIRWHWDADTLHIESRDAKDLAFYPAATCVGLIDPITDGVTAAGHLTLRFRPSARRNDGAHGLLVVGPPTRDPPDVFTIDIPHSTQDQEVR